MMPSKLQHPQARRWLLAAVIVLAATAGYLLGVTARPGENRDRGGSGAPDGGAAAAMPADSEWTCSMHPQIILPDEGQCPICFMDLIPLEKNAVEGLDPDDLILTDAAVALADIATEAARRRFVETEIRLVGAVTYDETRTAHIAAWVPGRLDRLHVAFTGQTVARGDRLAEIYSPELYGARAELQAAADAWRRSADHGERARQQARATLQSVRERLRLWGLSEEQIAELENGSSAAAPDAAQPAEHLTLRAPLGGVVVAKNAVEGMYVAAGHTLYTVADLSRVWVRLEAYEKDLDRLRVGQPVQFTAMAAPGRDFTGTIAFIDPVLDPATRTVGVRVEVDNREGLLKPGLLVKARCLVTLDADGRPVSDRDTAAPPLTIPATAALLTGERAIVYVRNPGPQPIFSGREVVLGARAGDWYHVVDGLAEGELVVTSGNFKIDSALQIQARPSMMNPASTTGGTTLEAGSAPPCFVDRLTHILAAYLPLQQALAADDDSAAATAGQAVAAALATVACAEDHLSELAREPWRDMYRAMERAATRLVRAGDIDRRRAAFQPLSDNLWAALAAFGAEPAQSVGLFHCPMAFDDAGADWIQTGETVANPYYGAKMLRCGYLKQPLVSEETDE